MGHIYIYTYRHMGGSLILVVGLLFQVVGLTGGGSQNLGGGQKVKKRVKSEKKGQKGEKVEKVEKVRFLVKK